jgi:NAD(P)-dependent dehydrogenase (short-subunit alcohol dehydrogenase family)
MTGEASDRSRLSGKVALVTGGASGIGQAIADTFRRHGAQVLVADKDAARGAALAERGIGFIACDVTREHDLVEAVAAAEREFGRLDVLVNNAGAPTSRAGILEFDATDWDAGMALHLRAHALGIKQAATAMRRTGGGSIVNTASISGLQSGLGPLIYSVAKAAVLQLTKQAALELAPHGVRVNAISPGWVATPIFAGGAEAETRDRVVEAVSSIADKLQPLALAGLPEHVAEAYLFLASDEARFITGATITADGGLTLSPAHAAAAGRRVTEAVAEALAR